ncbi:MAG: tRNA (N6-isopentenyl adenosine(37)-C2)-methylthiotransferase MiaB [Bacilli bacterium]|nr:tRNA (N6-isopentenyl adenosine(37)-C2)-methylthiotransferase MiaB [Mycoplasmatota bacterium]MDD6941542.1 tRNA (N6-isopentenyl adenosine(37)-C2)-methylthiotransferase MiaB [bacterium]MDY2697151.1 tRNA (N6-isopentenyl adenosine(37)-C2)-methylthiotransferase MiaB [Bacilli bacterium]MEE0014491.1 tRNA (N6-isopentenyl adenosine(37)-C2)-methylthiotransferase MiaB [Bacilli bacterium]
MHLPNYKDARRREDKDYKRVDFKFDSKIKDKYKGKTFYLKTYGCQMNEHDSENIEALLTGLGFKKVDNYENADLVLLNTCSIRENAHNKAFGMLGRLKHLKAQKKDLIVGLCGCMAQEASVVEEIIKKYSWVNFVFGTHNMYQLPNIIDRAIEENKQQIEVFSKEGDLVEGLPVIRTNNYKAYVNIIYGCNKFCTYCIVPYTRGRERSRAKEDILKEVDELIKDGYKEITLLGQNVNAYGKDLYDDYTLGNLLEDIAKKDIPRVRFMTSHPWDFTDSMVEVIGKYKNIMPSVHLPVQSGSSRILKLMGRRYTRESYLELFNKIKNTVPGVAISTDIIVGFPGETEEDFLETLSLVEECKYDNAFTFIFSKREGTPACLLKDETSEEEKENRLQRLNKVVNKYFLENNKKLENKIVEVLVEGVSEKDNMFYGYTDTNKLINFSSEKEVVPGDIIKVKVVAAKTWSLDGEAI